VPLTPACKRQRYNELLPWCRRQGVIALDALLARLAIEVVPMSAVAAEFAREGYARYGKGVGSPAVLNYGDALSYGVARAEDEPLLFTGEGFPETDIVSAAH
jgi:ribonuclease VapC